MTNANKRPAVSSQQQTWYILSEYRNVLMGLAILSIIFFHYTEDCQAHDLLNGWTYWYYTHIKSSSVDTFLFLSGFGLYFSFRKNSDTTLFYKKRFTKILIPYALVAIPAIIWAGRLTDKPVIDWIRDFFFISFFQDGTAWFWYILMICVCYLIFPYIFKIFESAENRITEQLRMISIFSFCTVICLILQSNSPEFFSHVEIALLRFPAFVLGCLIGKAAYEKRKIPRPVPVFMLLSLLMLSVLDTSKVVADRYILALFNLSLNLAFTFCLKKTEKQSKLHHTICSILKWFGKYSLELYLCHVAVRKIIKLYGYYTYEVKNELIMLALSFAAALLVKRLTNWILKCWSYGHQSVPTS